MTSDATVAPEAPPPAAGSGSSGRRVRLVLLLGLVVSVLAAVWLSVAHRRESARRQREAFDAAAAQTTEAAREIDRVFRDARSAADAVVRDLSDGTLAYADVETRMRAELAARPNLDGITIAFEPYVFDPKQQLHVEYASRQSDGTVSVIG